MWLARLGKQEEKNERTGEDNNVGRVSYHRMLQREKAISIGWG